MGKRFTTILSVSLFSIVVAACSGSAASSAPPAAATTAATAAPTEVASVAPSAATVACDSFTILNHRTDLYQSGDWKKLYVDPFAAKYPGIK